MKVRFVVQARVGSERLPGKVLAEIGPWPLIGHIWRRLRNFSSKEAEIFFAIPEEKNTLLTDWLQLNKIAFVTGSDQDVLSRYWTAIQGLDDSDFVVRLTGDNPFCDIPTMDTIFNRLREQPADFAYATGLPLGMGYEFIRVNALNSLKHYTLNSDDKEHVTLFIKRNVHLYDITPHAIGPFADEHRVYPSDLRLTVDEQADLALVRKTFSYFQKLSNPFFGARDVAGLYYRDPEFFKDNLSVSQKKVF